MTKNQTLKKNKKNIIRGLRMAQKSQNNNEFKRRLYHRSLFIILAGDSPRTRERQGLEKKHFQ